MENQEQLQHIKQLIQSAESSLQSAKSLLSQLTGDAPVSGVPSNISDKAREFGSESEEAGNRIINGLFDGQHMIGPDGKQYSVPANYASKSKLVEGDMLKLTIMNDGSFVYKQVGPIERTRVIGVLEYDDVNEEWKVNVSGSLYSVLLASVTYFKGDPGDEVVLLVPKGKHASWGAVENIIKKGAERPADLQVGDIPKEETLAEHQDEPARKPASDEGELDDL